jgi:hypothetical protein
MDKRLQDEQIALFGGQQFPVNSVEKYRLLTSGLDDNN